MKKQSIISVFLLTAITLTSCASLSPPGRPGYAGIDNISSAQPGQLIGTWRVTDLNPIAGTEPNQTIIEYRADGSVIGNLRIDGEEFEAIGPIEFELTGQWTLNADTVIHENITMNSKSESEFGSLISNVINQQKGISGQANIYELSPDRIVMLSSDGAAKEYIRQ